MKPLNLIALLLFVGGAVWALTRSDGTVREIQRGYFSMMAPFLTSGSKLETKSREFLAEVKHSKELETKLHSVDAEIGRLQLMETKLRQVESENAQLRHALKFKEATSFDVVAANVVRRQPGNLWWETVDIDAGSDQKVGIQLAVMTNEGLVGKIDRADKNRSSVLLLTDEKCQVSAMVEDSPEVGILSGQRGKAEGEPRLLLRFLSKEALVKPGQRVFTTGRGGIFQAKVLLGTIEHVRKGGLDSEAIVRPSVDFANLNTVFVVLSADR